MYRQRLFALITLKLMDGFAGLRGWGLLALTTLPARILGAIAHGSIRAQLFDPKTVVIGLGAGGVAIPLVLGVLAHARMRSRGGSSSSARRPAYHIGTYIVLNAATSIVGLEPAVADHFAVRIGHDALESHDKTIRR